MTQVIILDDSYLSTSKKEAVLPESKLDHYDKK